MNPNRQDELRARMGASSQKLPAALERLGNALWNPDEDAFSHEQCRNSLPQYIFAEVMGEPVALRFPLVKQHLDHCDECGEEYAELLDTAWAEQRGTLMKPQSIPRPDLSFLPARESAFEERVLEWARNIVGHLLPTGLAELESIARLHLSSLKTRQANEERSIYLPEGANDTSGVRALLTASYATTKMLVARVNRQEFDTWTGSDQTKLQVQAFASNTASELGLPEELRSDFSDAYADAVTRDPSALRDLLE